MQLQLQLQVQLQAQLQYNYCSCKRNYNCNYNKRNCNCNCNCNYNFNFKCNFKRNCNTTTTEAAKLTATTTATNSTASRHRSRGSHLLPEETLPRREVGALEQSVLQDALHTSQRLPSIRKPLELVAFKLDSWHYVQTINQCFVMIFQAHIKVGGDNKTRREAHTASKHGPQKRRQRKHNPRQMLTLPRLPIVLRTSENQIHNDFLRRAHFQQDTEQYYHCLLYTSPSPRD